MRLILVRHPAPLVAPGVCYGRTDLAVADAERARTGAALAAVLPAHTPIYASPLQRCAALARDLHAALAGSTLTFDARLVEIDFGAWEMQPWDSIARAEIDAWAADVAGYHPGGGESVQQAALRVKAFYAALQRSGVPCAIVVCHAGSMRLLAACHLGLAPAEAAAHAANTPHHIPYGGLLTLADHGPQHQFPV